MDLRVFIRIAECLLISDRYVGEEPTSQVTGLYNRIMSQALPDAGIACHIIPRKEKDGRAISASDVRQAIQRGNWTMLRSLVPDSTLAWFESPEAEPVIRQIHKAGDVVHY